MKNTTVLLALTFIFAAYSAGIFGQKRPVAKPKTTVDKSNPAEAAKDKNDAPVETALTPKPSPVSTGAGIF